MLSDERTAAVLAHAEDRARGKASPRSVSPRFDERGLEAKADALRLAMDYFHLARDEFGRRWLPDRTAESSRWA